MNQFGIRRAVRLLYLINIQNYRNGLITVYFLPRYWLGSLDRDWYNDPVAVDILVGRLDKVVGRLQKRQAIGNSGVIGSGDLVRHKGVKPNSTNLMTQ